MLGIIMSSQKGNLDEKISKKANNTNRVNILISLLLGFVLILVTICLNIFTRYGQILLVIIIILFISIIIYYFYDNKAGVCACGIFVIIPIILFGIACLQNQAGIFSQLSATPSPLKIKTVPNITVNITYPSNDTFIDIKPRIKGTVTNFTSDYHIWLIDTTTPNNSTIPINYPLGEATIADDNSNWTYFGTPIGGSDSKNVTFKIRALLTDEEASKKLLNESNIAQTDYFDHNITYPGLHIPDGAEIRAEVIVKRK